ncbi:hypothetical protein R6Q59_007427 [Mikania micrantha]
MSQRGEDGALPSYPSMADEEEVTTCICRSIVFCLRSMDAVGRRPWVTASQLRSRWQQLCKRVLQYRKYGTNLGLESKEQSLSDHAFLKPNITDSSSSSMDETLQSGLYFNC